MFELENFDEINRGGGLEESGLSPEKLDYINEVLPTGNADWITDRIDEIQGIDLPRKALDADPQIAQMLEPIKDSIDSTCLEAPTDFEQAEMIADTMRGIEGVDYETWRDLSVEDRISVLQEIENGAADIAHRTPCIVIGEPMEASLYGYYKPRWSPDTVTPEQISQALAEQPVIMINSDLLDGSYENYKEAMDTILHEGRHAYQEYNMYEREVHTSPGDVKNWIENEFGYKYQEADSTFVGDKCYYMQPLEADARKFATDIMSSYENGGKRGNLQQLEGDNSQSKEMTLEKVKNKIETIKEVTKSGIEVAEGIGKIVGVVGGIIITAVEITKKIQKNS